MSRSHVFVGVQFAALLYIAATGPLFARNPILLALEFAGIGLGLWAIAAMGIGNFKLTPDVKETGEFVARGPYRAIRHPMYSALLLASLALVLDHWTPVRALVWLLLLANMVWKLHYEEQLLVEAFPVYRAYRENTKRLIPYLY